MRIHLHWRSRFHVAEQQPSPGFQFVFCNCLDSPQEMDFGKAWTQASEWQWSGPLIEVGRRWEANLFYRAHRGCGLSCGDRKERRRRTPEPCLDGSTL